MNRTQKFVHWPFFLWQALQTKVHCASATPSTHLKLWPHLKKKNILKILGVQNKEGDELKREIQEKYIVIIIYRSQWHTYLTEVRACITFDLNFALICLPNSNFWSAFSFLDFNGLCCSCFFCWMCCFPSWPLAVTNSLLSSSFLSFTHLLLSPSNSHTAMSRLNSFPSLSQTVPFSGTLPHIFTSNFQVFLSPKLSTLLLVCLKKNNPAYFPPTIWQQWLTSDVVRVSPDIIIDHPSTQICFSGGKLLILLIYQNIATTAPYQKLSDFPKQELTALYSTQRCPGPRKTVVLC